MLFSKASDIIEEYGISDLSSGDITWQCQDCLDKNRLRINSLRVKNIHLSLVFHSSMCLGWKTRSGCVFVFVFSTEWCKAEVITWFYCITTCLLMKSFMSCLVWQPDSAKHQLSWSSQSGISRLLGSREFMTTHNALRGCQVRVHLGRAVALGVKTVHTSEENKGQTLENRTSWAHACPGLICN